MATVPCPELHAPTAAAAPGGRGRVRFFASVLAGLASVLVAAGCADAGTSVVPEAPATESATAELAGSQPGPDPGAEARPSADPEPPTGGAAAASGRDRGLLGAGVELFGGSGGVATRAMGLQETRPADADLLMRIGAQPQAEWLGNWSGDVERTVRDRTRSAAAVGRIPVFVVYNLPQRDCGHYSAGGRRDADDYLAWIDALAAGIGDRPAVLVLEPDAIGHLDCLDERSRELRLDLLRAATRRFEQDTAAAVYLDAGHSAWLDVDEAARRLVAAGVEHARGFALNVSNFQWDEELVAYGTEVALAVGGDPLPHFVIDSSRNGNGPFPAEEDPTGEPWCNPPGRALGRPPTLDTGVDLLDAYLWIKRPAESDGACRGAPPAGQLHLEYALELARNAEP